jgi:hypothetical protein
MQATPDNTAQSSGRGHSILLILAAIVVVAAGIREASGILTPILAAAFISMIAILPLALLQGKLGVPRWIALLIVLALTLGGALGIGFYLPVLFNPPAVQPSVHSTGRLLYDISNLHSGWHNFVNTEPVGELVYWGFIVLPLVALRDKAVKLFGILIFVSIFLTWFTYSKTFNSVWCFYCAVLSIFVIWIINRPRLSSRQAP